MVLHIMEYWCKIVLGLVQILTCRCIMFFVSVDWRARTLEFVVWGVWDRGDRRHDDVMIFYNGNG